MSGDWLGPDRGRIGAERILEAAAGLFAERGVGGVGMAEVAAAAGCSRATLYRYFPDRGQLHLAFVQREAVRVGRRVAEQIAEGSDPAARVTEGVLVALQEVRRAPALAAWFTDGDAGRAAAVAQSSTVIEALGLTVVPDPDAADWLVRAILSLLTVPGADDAAERRLVERFVAPVVAGTAVGSGA